MKTKRTRKPRYTPDQETKRRAIWSEIEGMQERCSRHLEAHTQDGKRINALLMQLTRI